MPISRSKMSKRAGIMQNDSISLFQNGVDTSPPRPSRSKKSPPSSFQQGRSMGRGHIRTFCLSFSPTNNLFREIHLGTFLNIYPKKLIEIFKILLHNRLWLWAPSTNEVEVCMTTPLSFRKGIDFETKHSH